MKKVIALIFIGLIVVISPIFSIDNEKIITNDQYKFYEYFYAQPTIILKNDYSYFLPKFGVFKESDSVEIDEGDIVEIFAKVYLSQWTLYNPLLFRCSYGYINNTKANTLFVWYSSKEVEDLINDTVLKFKTTMNIYEVRPYKKIIFKEDNWREFRFTYDLSQLNLEQFIDIAESQTLEILIDLYTLELDTLKIVKLQRYIKNFIIPEISKEDLLYMYENYWSEIE